MVHRTRVAPGGFTVHLTRPDSNNPNTNNDPLVVEVVASCIRKSGGKVEVAFLMDISNNRKKQTHQTKG